MANIPIYDRNLHTSFIFDRLAPDNNLVEKKRVLNIDPTDKRYDFGNEVKRFVNEQQNKLQEKEGKDKEKHELSRASAFSRLVQL
jgi:hypothetical protein